MECNLYYTKLCIYCFQVLENFLSNKEIDNIPFPEEFKGKSYPLFVTWRIGKGKEKELRGCIGTFSKDNLEKNLMRYTFSSAFKDSRFPPISKNEVKYLSCEVSLLDHFEKANSPVDWVIGKHGIDIDFDDQKGNNYSATYLPHVAEKENWDHETTLKHLIRKAGYKGTLESVYKNIEVTRYQSIKTALSYQEYENRK